MRTAVAAFIAAGLFLAGVLVGLGSQRPGAAPAPVALTATGGSGQHQNGGPAGSANQRGSDVKQVRRMVGYGELDHHGGQVTYQEDTAGGGDQGSTADDTSGPGGGGDDNSGPGSDSSGPGSDSSGPGSGSSGSGSSGPG
jgi:hypothetical protein